MKRLEGKVCLITGAGQGIGEATALKFAREGAVVIACDLKQEQVEAVAQACRVAGAQAASTCWSTTPASRRTPGCRR